MVSCTILDADEVTGDIADAWRAILADTPHLDSPFFRPEFAKAAAAARADAFVAVFKRAGEPIAFLPHFRRPGGFARPIGAPFNDCHGLIARDADALSGGEALALAGLRAFRFNGLVDPGALFATFLKHQEHAHVADLGQDGEAYLAGRRALHGSHFKKVRRRLRKMEREVGPAALLLDDRTPAHFETLLRWKRRQYIATGLHDVLRPHWARAMLQRLLTQSDDAFRPMMTTLTVGGVPAAIEFNLRAGGLLHGWIVAYNPEFAEHSPGVLVMHQLLGAAPTIGVTRYDMGPGHDHYKKYYANAQAARLDGLAWSPCPLGRLAGFRASTIRGLEGAALGPVSKFAGKARRRLDQIAAAEPTLVGRLQGVSSAISRRVFQPALFVGA